jgi:hypothetical protein
MISNLKQILDKLKCPLLNVDRYSHLPEELEEDPNRDDYLILWNYISENNEINKKNMLEWLLL